MKNIIVSDKDSLLFEPNNLTVETIKRYLCEKATDQELLMGLQIAKTFNLNPLKREIYFVKYSDKDKMQVLTGYEVYIKRAERSGKYNGLEITSEGSVKNGDLKAIVKVYRKDWTHPLTHEAYYSEYVQMKGVYQNGVKTGEEPNVFWAKKPITMIKKVTVSQAFRLAFPDEFDGMPYTSDETIDQEKVIDVHLSEDNVPEVPQNANKPCPSDLPENEPITSEQGEALLTLLKKNGYTREDLKSFIEFEFELKTLKSICNKHLLRTKEAFSHPKPKETK